MREKPSAARSSASSHEAGRSSPDTRTSGSVNRTWPRAFLVLAKAHLLQAVLLESNGKNRANGPVLSKPAGGGGAWAGRAGPRIRRYLSAGTPDPFRGPCDEPTADPVGGRAERRAAHGPVRADDGAGVLAGWHERARGVQPVRADAAARAQLPAGVRRRRRARAAGGLPLHAGLARVPGGDRPVRARVPG